MCDSCQNDVYNLFCDYIWSCRAYHHQCFYDDAALRYRSCIRPHCPIVCAAGYKNIEHDDRCFHNDGNLWYRSCIVRNSFLLTCHCPEREADIQISDPIIQLCVLPATRTLSTTTSATTSFSSSVSSSTTSSVTSTTSTVPTPSCSPGLSLSVVLGICVSQQPPQIVDGVATCTIGVFDPVLNICVSLNTSGAPTCGDNEILDAVANICLVQSTPTVVDGVATCPIGLILNTVANVCIGQGSLAAPATCPIGAIVDPLLGICLFPASTTTTPGVPGPTGVLDCPIGASLSTTLGICISQQTPHIVDAVATCAIGAVLDPLLNLCVIPDDSGAAAPVCGPNETLDTIANICLLQQSPIVDNGVSTW